MPQAPGNSSRIGSVSSRLRGSVRLPGSRLRSTAPFDPSAPYSYSSRESRRTIEGLFLNRLRSSIKRSSSARSRQPHHCLNQGGNESDCACGYRQHADHASPNIRREGEHHSDGSANDRDDRKEETPKRARRETQQGGDNGDDGWDTEGSLTSLLCIHERIYNESRSSASEAPPQTDEGHCNETRYSRF
jgi:hypothetical protein